MLIRTTVFASLLICSIYSCNQNAKKKSEATPTTNSTDTLYLSAIRQQLDSIFEEKHKLHGFSGSVAVSYKGSVLYARAFGYADYKKQIANTINTPSQLASVSKTFTATATLYLIDHQLIGLHDTIQKFIPDFPYKGVTIQQLLCHRSGLANYLYFADALCKTGCYLTNEQIISYMIAKKPALDHIPGKHFAYCNTNYMLLAAIIEKVTHQKFPAFMKQTFFEPLGMQNTFVMDYTDSACVKPSISYNSGWSVQNDNCFDGVWGDKGVYSSAMDMLKWDKAFYDGKLISEPLLKEAYMPRSFEKPGVRNYGYGWRLLQQPDGSQLVYHNGWWHGNNTVFYRNIRDTTAIVVLGNKYSRDIYNIRSVWNVLHNTSDSLDQDE